MIVLCDPPGYVATRGSIYLPIVVTEPVNPVAAFYQLLTADQRQQRPRLQRCESLEEAAEWKAQDIIANGYWAHQAHGGEWPNATARRFGCNLPVEYGDNWNGCESLVAGSPDAAVMFTALAGSPSHRVHLFGEVDFYRVQTHVGVAMVAGGQWGWVWVLLIAACQ